MSLNSITIYSHNETYTVSRLRPAASEYRRSAAAQPSHCLGTYSYVSDIFPPCGAAAQRGQGLLILEVSKSHSL